MTSQNGPDSLVSKKCDLADSNGSRGSESRARAFEGVDKAIIELPGRVASTGSSAFAQPSRPCGRSSKAGDPALDVAAKRERRSYGDSAPHCGQSTNCTSSGNTSARASTNSSDSAVSCHPVGPGLRSRVRKTGGHRSHKLNRFAGADGLQGVLAAPYLASPPIFAGSPEP